MTAQVRSVHRQAVEQDPTDPRPAEEIITQAATEAASVSTQPTNQVEANQLLD
jgi:hypothetical protein